MMTFRYKKNYIAILFGLMSFNGFAQHFNTDCYADSTMVLEIEQKFNEMECEKLPFEKFANRFLRQRQAFEIVFEPNKFCDLKIYAKIFDFLLKNELDLNYDFFKNMPVSFSQSSTDPEVQARIELLKIEQQKKDKSQKKKRDVYAAFLSLNEHYNMTLIKAYKKSPKANLANDVNNLIKYGAYMYPNQVSNILRGNYKDLNLKNLYNKYTASH